MPGRGRGRGRGGRGGRGRSGGRGGGRGGRGRSGGRRGGHSRPGTQGDDAAQKDKAPIELNIETDDPRKFFTGAVPFEQHVKGQTENRTRYAAAMAVLAKTGVTIAQNARVRALAAAWARGDHQLAQGFLADRASFGLVELLKAVTLLDAGRQLRVMEKKLRRLELSGAKVSPAKLGKIKSDMDNLRALKPPVGSASGALSKQVKQWTRTLTKEELEFYALFFPTENWKKLADICHFHPAKDFPALPWFLPFCFGTPAPESSMVFRSSSLTEENVNALLKEFPIPYSHVKRFKGSLDDHSKEQIARHDKLDTILWWYEDLRCEAVDRVLEERMSQGETITLPLGKLMERLLTLKRLYMSNSNQNQQQDQQQQDQQQDQQQQQDKQQEVPFFSRLLSLANTRLQALSLPLEAPVVVLGDASASMGVAVRTSTIIASLLTAISAARLAFFKNTNIDAPFLPETIEQVLELALTIPASNSTAPAASLWPFYERKEVVKTFIIVTDEEENTSCQNYRFCPLFKKYVEEVFPAKLVFVSFLAGQHSQGQMVRELKRVDETIKPLQFRLDRGRPDLTKLDNLLGLLAADALDFGDEIGEVESAIQAKGLQDVFRRLGSRQPGEEGALPS